MTVDQRTDSQLLQASRGGDMDAFGVFYVRYRKVLLGHLVRRLRKPELAADVMAESFARALIVVKDDQAELPNAPAAWLFAVALNLVRDSARSKRVEMTARARLGLERVVLGEDDIDKIFEIAAAHDLPQDVRSYVSELEWQALCARVVDEQPYAVIAEQLCCSQAVVRKRVSRARSHYEQHSEDPMPDFLERYGEQLRLAEQRHYGAAAVTRSPRRRRVTRRRGLLALLVALLIAAPAAALVGPWNPTVGRPAIDEPTVPPSSAPYSSDAVASFEILRRAQTERDREVAEPLLRALGHPVGGVQLDGVRALPDGWILAPARIVDTGRAASTNQLCITNGSAIACSNARQADDVGVGLSAANAHQTKIAGLVPDRVARVRFVTRNGTRTTVAARNNFYSLTVNETMATRMIPAPKDRHYTGPDRIPSPPTPIGGTLIWLSADDRAIGPRPAR